MTQPSIEEFKVLMMSSDCQQEQHLVLPGMTFLSRSIQPGGSATIPTGVRIVRPESAVLLIVPRSGSGFKYGVSLANTVSVIDSDYYNPDTGSEGHIMAKLFNHDHHEPVTFHFNDGFMQGIIVPYSTLPEYDNKNAELFGIEERTGGFGSTSKEGSRWKKKRSTPQKT